MSYKSIHNLLNSVAQEMDADNTFKHLRVQDRAKAEGISYPLFQLFPIKIKAPFVPSSNRMSPIYNCVIGVLMMDKDDSTPEEQLQIIEQTDLFCMEYVLKLNNKILSSSEFSSDVELDNVAWEPIYRITTDITTGHLLSFTIQVPDDFNFC